uniref:Uncharacterized protein n=1 Tax=Rhizophora mucronata TaxID=61149 RepID=A0A2P2Q5X1_RHIMU
MTIFAMPYNAVNCPRTVFQDGKLQVPLFLSSVNLTQHNKQR